MGKKFTNALENKELYLNQIQKIDDTINGCDFYYGIDAIRLKAQKTPTGKNSTIKGVPLLKNYWKSRYLHICHDKTDKPIILSHFIKGIEKFETLIAQGVLPNGLLLCGYADDYDNWHIAPSIFKNLTDNEKLYFKSSYQKELISFDLGHSEKIIFKRNNLKLRLCNLYLNHATEKISTATINFQSQYTGVNNAIFQYSPRNFEDIERKIIAAIKRHLKQCWKVENFEWNLFLPYEIGRLMQKDLSDGAKNGDLKKAGKTYKTTCYIVDGRGKCAVPIKIYNVSANVEGRGYTKRNDTFKLEFTIRDNIKGFDSNILHYGTASQVTLKYVELIKKKLIYCFDKVGKGTFSALKQYFNIGRCPKAQALSKLVDILTSPERSIDTLIKKKKQLEKKISICDKIMVLERIKNSNRDYVKSQSVYIVTLPETDNIIILDLDNLPEDPPARKKRKKSAWLEFEYVP